LKRIFYGYWSPQDNLGRILATFNTTFIALGVMKSFVPYHFAITFTKSFQNSLPTIERNFYQNKYLRSLDFSKGDIIHEAIGVTYEHLHSIKTKNQRATVAKVDLWKAFDRLNYLFFCLIPIPLDFR
jgi:hypothetical protein